MGAESGSPLILVCREKPHSWNARTTADSYAKFGRALARAFADTGRPGLDGSLYGVVYWFVRGYRSKDPDADNISKPVWDMLGTRRTDTPEHEVRLGVYDDDKQVRLRIAGIVDLSPASLGDPIEPVDLPPLPEKAAEVFHEFVVDVSSRHLVYIECGPLRSGMFVSNLVGGPP